MKRAHTKSDKLFSRLRFGHTRNPIPQRISTDTKRRTFSELRELIIQTLERFPQSSYSVAQTCKMNLITAQRHLKVLEKLERVKSLKTKHGTYWKLKHERE